MRELSFHLLPSQGWVSDVQTGHIQGSRAIPSFRFLYIEVLFLTSLIKVNCGNRVGVRGTPSGLPQHISPALSPRPRLSLFPLWPWEAQECRRYQSKIHSEMFYWTFTMCQVLLSVNKKTKFLAPVERTFQQNQAKRRLGFFVCFEVVLVSRKGVGLGVRQAWVKRPTLIIQMTSGQAT